MIPVSLIFSSLRHSPARTLLTALGTALGVATIVALLAVGQGAQRSAGQFLHLGSSDLALYQSDAADPTTSILPTALIAKLLRTPGVAQATPFLLLVEDVPRQPSAIVFGADPSGFLSRRLVFGSGRMFRFANEIVVGDELASQLRLSPGDSLTVDHHAMRVAGVYHIGIAYQDGGAFIPLATAQALTGHQGEATIIGLKLAVGTRLAAARRTLHARFPGTTVISDAEEAPRAGANAQLVGKAALVIAVLALVIGGIGVANTMLISVVERRSEFALLSAVGWSGPQIAARVLVESVATTLLGAALGLIVGVLGAHGLVRVLAAQEFVSPQFTAWGLGRAVLVGVLLGVIGGLYPAWRASHVSPAQVLAQH